MFDWSGKNADKSGKSQGILISCVSGNPGYALKKSSINRKRTVLYPCPGFLSSASWPDITSA